MADSMKVAKADEPPADPAAKYNEDEERDERGRWTGGGGGGSQIATANFGKSRKANVAEAHRAVQAAGFPTEEWHKAGTSTPMMYNNSTDKIAINSAHKFWTDPKTWMENAYKTGQLSSGDPSHILNHEIGHAIYTPSDNWITSAHPVIAKEVSKYAAVNPKEFVSEVHAGRAGGREFSPGVNNLFDTYARKRSTASKLAKASDDQPDPTTTRITPEQQAAIDAMVADITLDLTDEQVAELEAYLSTIVSDTSSLAYAQVNLDATGDFFEHMHTEALKWAEQNAADLVSGIADTTRDQVRQAIVDGYLNNLSVAEIADSIESIGAFSADRAALIASTEIAAANSAGSLAGYRQAQSNGVSVLKQWLNADTSDVCNDCQENADEGPIDLDEVFPSGDDAPPGHPRCHCAICPVVVDDTGEEAPADTAPADAEPADEDFADSEDA